MPVEQADEGLDADADFGVVGDEGGVGGEGEVAFLEGGLVQGVLCWERGGGGD